VDTNILEEHVAASFRAEVFGFRMGVEGCHVTQGEELRKELSPSD
jgi:hypothetical protein